MLHKVRCNDVCVSIDGICMHALTNDVRPDACVTSIFWTRDTY